MRGRYVRGGEVVKLWTKLHRWWTGYDARMRYLQSFSRDKSRFTSFWELTNLKRSVLDGHLFNAGFDHYKLTDAGAKAVEEWREGR